MKKIASFTINHNTLMPGVYISRIDGDITTYDMRFVKPNTPPYLPNPVMPVSYTHLTLPSTSRRQRQMCIRDRHMPATANLPTM